MQDFLNGGLSIAAAIGLSYVVLSPRIEEGGLIKVGLIAMIFSLIASAAYSFLDLPMALAFKAAVVLRGGIVVVCVGYWFKFKRHRRDGTPTDFGSLTER